MAAALYFIFGFIILIYEIQSLNKGEPVLDRDDAEDDMLGCVFGISYVLWYLIGLVTAQWLFYIIYFFITYIIHFLWKRNRKKSLYRIGSAISVFFILFVILNHFHFQFDSFDLISFFT